MDSWRELQGEAAHYFARQKLHLGDIDIQIYDWMFDQLDHKRRGFVKDAQVRNLLLSSQLPKSVLASIWERAISGHPKLSRSSFYVILQLVAAEQGGRSGINIADLLNLNVSTGRPTFEGVSYDNIVSKLATDQSFAATTPQSGSLASSVFIPPLPQSNLQSLAESPSFGSLLHSANLSPRLDASPHMLSIPQPVAFPPPTTFEYLGSNSEDQPLPELVITAELSQVYVKGFENAASSFGTISPNAPGAPEAARFINETAVKFFDRVGLPPQNVARAWKLAHIYTPQQIGVDVIGFCIAMHLCRLMHSRVLPTAPHSLSHALLVSARVACGIDPAHAMAPVPTHLLLVDAPPHVQQIHDQALVTFLMSAAGNVGNTFTQSTLGSTQTNRNISVDTSRANTPLTGAAMPAFMPLSSTPVATPSFEPQPNIIGVPLTTLISPQAQSDFAFPGANSKSLEKRTAPKSEASTFGATSMAISERDIEAAELMSEEASLHGRYNIVEEQLNNRTQFIDRKQKEFEEVRDRVAKQRLEVEEIERKEEELKEQANILRKAITEERYAEERLMDQQSFARFGLMAAEKALKEVEEQAAHTLELRSKIEAELKNYSQELLRIRGHIIEALKPLASDVPEISLPDDFESLFEAETVPEREISVAPGEGKSDNDSEALSIFGDFGSNKNSANIKDTSTQKNIEIDIFGFSQSPANADNSFKKDVFEEEKAESSFVDDSIKFDSNKPEDLKVETMSLRKRVFKESETDKQVQLVKDAVKVLPVLIEFRNLTEQKKEETNKLENLVSITKSECEKLKEVCKQLMEERNKTLTQLEKQRDDYSSILAEKEKLQRELDLLQNESDGSSLTHAQKMLREQAAANVSLEREIEQLKKHFDDAVRSSSEETLVDLNRHQALKSRNEVLLSEAQRLRHKVSLTPAPTPKVDKSFKGHTRATSTASAPVGSLQNGNSGEATTTVLTKLPSIIASEVASLSSKVLPQGMTVAQVDAAITDEWDLDESLNVDQLQPKVTHVNLKGMNVASDDDDEEDAGTGIGSFKEADDDDDPFALQPKVVPNKTSVPKIAPIPNLPTHEEEEEDPFDSGDPFGSGGKETSVSSKSEAVKVSDKAEAKNDEWNW